MKNVTEATAAVIEAAVANTDAGFGDSVATLAHAASIIRQSCKPTDAEWANTLGMVYGILGYMTDTKDGDKELGAEWAGGTFGQKVFMAAACDLAADLGKVNRNKLTGKAGKVKYTDFTVGLLNGITLGRYEKIAGELLEARLEAIELAYHTAEARAHGEYHMAMDAAEADEKKLAKVRDELIAKADDLCEKAKLKAHANHARAVNWFKSLDDGIVAYLTAILRTLDPNGIKVGNVTYGPDAIVIACLAGYVPSAKDVATAIKSDNYTVAAIDQVKAEARTAQKTLGNLLVAKVNSIVATVEPVAA